MDVRNAGRVGGVLGGAVGRVRRGIRGNFVMFPQCFVVISWCVCGVFVVFLWCSWCFSFFLVKSCGVFVVFS